MIFLSWRNYSQRWFSWTEYYYYIYIYIYIYNFQFCVCIYLLKYVGVSTPVSILKYDKLFVYVLVTNGKLYVLEKYVLLPVKFF